MRSIAICSPFLLLSGGFAQLAQAQQPQDVPLQNRPGLCALIYNLEGRSVILSNGQLVRLVDYCATIRANANQTIQAADPELNPDSNEFLQTFLEVASPEARQFAESAGRENVITYGMTICPMLREGNTMQDIRRTQIRGGLPAAFDAAVNVAAVKTYCPQYESQIGR